MDTPNVAEATTPKMSLAHMVMDVVSPPPAADKPAPTPNAHKQVDKKPEPATDASKKPTIQQQNVATPKNGVALAITATVIIVLGLATLATYAYLQTV
jgi:hypothetical protein